MRPDFLFSLAICLVLAFSACDENQSASSVEEAENLLVGGDPAAAFAKAEALLEADASDMAAVYVAAQALHEIGDYYQSNFYLGELLEAETTNGQGFYLRGLNYRALGDFEKAFEAFNVAVKYAPNLDEAKEILLGSHYENYDWKTFEDRLWGLEKEGYEGAVFFGMCGIRDMLAGKYEAGLEKAELAIARAPGKGMEWFKARIQLEQGKPEAALLTLGDQPQNPYLGLRADELTGWAFLQIERFDSVEQCIERLNRDKRSGRADQLEARMLVRQGYHEDAVRLLLETEFEEQFTYTWINFLEEYNELEDFGSRGGYYSHENRFYHEASVYAVYFLIEEGDLEGAEKNLKLIFKQNPNYALAHWMMGWIHLGNDAINEASSSFHRAQSLNIEILYGDEIMDRVPASCK